jgi:putative ATP-dependent endonuclease of OLD family
MDDPVTDVPTTNAPRIHRLSIERFRGIENLTWHPENGVNIILGGGDTGKTTILEAIALLLHPATSPVLTDADYWQRGVRGGFSIEGVFSLPASCGVSEQPKHFWPWQWDGKNLSVPSPDGGSLFHSTYLPVYVLRVRGTDDFDLLFELVQPNGEADGLGIGLRRRIGLVRLSGDDRNDRDLRLVQGSALERLIDDKTLRAKLGSKFAEENVDAELALDAQKKLQELNKAFQARQLPNGLGLGLTGSQGISLNALIGLTAEKDGVHLPLSSWGAGTRRLSALEIASAHQGENPITLVDEIERGLEPYRQRDLMLRIQEGQSQVFVTTHSPAALRAGSKATVWYLDAKGRIGKLPSKGIVHQHRERDPESLLSRLVIFTEGKTEFGFVHALLKKAIGPNLLQHGIWISDAEGHDKILELLDTFGKNHLACGGFADEERVNSGRWACLKNALGNLLFRWKSSCTESEIIALVPENGLKQLIDDPTGEKSGDRRRTLAYRLGISEKDFDSLKAKSPDIRKLVIEAATGFAPNDQGLDESTKKTYRKHCQCWFKSHEGGEELLEKVFALGVWPQLKNQLLPFVNAVRTTLSLPEIQDLS